MGLLTGLAGVGLAALGLLLGLFAGIRLLWVIRRPGKGRFARGVGVAGLVLLLCGALLFTVEEVGTPLRAASDESVHYLAGLAVLLAAFAGVRSARRRPAVSAVQPIERAEAGAQEPAENLPDVGQRP